jgi:hypothetical protein
MKFLIIKLHAQRLCWKPNNKNVLCWAFDYVNDNKEVDLTTLQVIYCILCYNSPVLNLNPKLQARRKLIIYYTISCMIFIKKTCKFKPFQSFFLKWKRSKQSFEKIWMIIKKKKKQTCLLVPYLFFLLERSLLRKMIFGRCGPLIVKNHLPL